MNRTHANRELLGVVLTALLAAYGCTKDTSTIGSVIEEPVSSGGEAPLEELEDEELEPTESAEEDPELQAEIPLDAPLNPELELPVDYGARFGATRSQQCAAPPARELSRSARNKIERGVKHANQGDALRAEQEFKDALVSDANAHPAMHNLGLLALRKGNRGEAVSRFEQALSIAPGYAPALRGLASIYIEERKLSRALQLTEAAARKAPTNLELQALYAELLVHASRTEDAWRTARAALRCDERHVPSLIALIKASYKQGRRELAESILDQALAIDDKVAELHLMQAKRISREPGRLRETIALYEKVIALQPGYTEAHVLLGVQLLYGGNYDRALKHFKTAVELDSTKAVIHLDLAEALRATKQWDQALNAYRQALSLDPELAQAHFGMGLLYRSAMGNVAGLDELSALRMSVNEFKTYRDAMGAKLKRDDPSRDYLSELAREIKRTEKRIQRERNRNATISEE